MKYIKIYKEPELKSQAKRDINTDKIKTVDFKIDKKYILPLYKKLHFYTRTYGCQANVIDSQVISRILLNLGFKQTNEIKKADFVILNTCAIRQNAENKVYGEIGFINGLRSKNNNFRLAVSGCMPLQEITTNKLKKDNKVDLVFGVHNIDELPKYVYEIYKNNTKIISIKHKKNNYYKLMPRQYENKHKALVTIMDGCDNFCTYCIVPYTRGQQISRSKDDIINEIKQLIKNGCKEVTLIGQNVNAYGIDFKAKKYNFKDLLVDVAKLKIPRIRFATSNPWNFDLSIIDVIKKYPNIMPAIHLPIQSGDQEILRRMNRTMKISDYYRIIKYINKNIKNCSITTDIIVGFPNETNKQFDNTLKFYKKVKFDNAFTFIYSKRTGTPAAKMEDKISLDVKQKRLAKLNELVCKYAKLNNKKFLNKTVEVLVEGISKTNNSRLMGYSPQLKVVNFNGHAKIGDIVKVKITSYNRFSLIGNQVD